MNVYNSKEDTRKTNAIHQERIPTASPVSQGYGRAETRGHRIIHLTVGPLGGTWGKKARNKNHVEGKQ